MDYVFISGSAFVNKTMPRLLALASEAHTVVLGPSAPASPAILQAGATTVMSFASAHPEDRPLLSSPEGVTLVARILKDARARLAEGAEEGAD